LFDHLSFGLDLAPSVYHLFTNLKNWLRSQNFSSNEELMEGVKTWLSSQAACLFDSYKNVFPVTINASVLAVTTLRSSLSMYIKVFFVYNILFPFASFVNS
jgi:hypothetical protein